MEVSILRLIKDDPFMTISEIHRELTRRNPSISVGWWGIFLVMRKKRLLRRKARFKYAWGRY